MESLSKNTRERNVKYEFIRVIMSLFVICIHTQLPDSINNKLLVNIILAFLFQCNGIFFMMSGKMHLHKKFETTNDYIKYYINKFVNIIIPYGVVTCILVLLRIIETNQYCNFNGYVYQCYVAFFSTNAQNYLWFVCVLIVSIPAHFEPAVRTLRATLPALRAIFPVSGNHHFGFLES